MVYLQMPGRESLSFGRQVDALEAWMLTPLRENSTWFEVSPLLPLATKIEQFHRENTISLTCRFNRINTGFKIEIPGPGNRLSLPASSHLSPTCRDCTVHLRSRLESWEHCTVTTLRKPSYKQHEPLLSLRTDFDAVRNINTIHYSA